MITEPSKEERLNEAQKYLDEFDIQSVVSEMLNSLLHEKDKHPYVYMIKYLASMMSEEERKQFNLSIPGPFPQAHPIVSFPKFLSEKKSELKTHLTKEIFALLKKKKTKFGNNINSVTKTKLDDDVNCALCDGDTVNVYPELLNPIIEDIHKIKIEDLKEFTVNYRTLNTLTSFGQKEIEENASKVVFSFSRNLQEYPYNFFQCGREKIKLISAVIQNQIQGKIIDHLENEFSIYEFKDELDTDLEEFKKIDYDFSWLEKAEMKQCWPEGRKVISNSKKDIIILVNFANHLEIYTVWEKGHGRTIEETYNLLIKIIKQLSISLQFDVHKELGFITSDIKQIGYGFKISTDLKLKNTKFNNLEASDLISKINFDFAEIDKEGNVKVSETCKLSEIDCITFIEKYSDKIAGLLKIFNSEAEPKISFEPLKLEENESNKVVIDSYNKTFESIKYYISAIGTNINNMIEKYAESNVFKVNHPSEYIAFYPFFREYLLQTQKFDIAQKEHIHRMEHETEMDEIEEEDFHFIEFVKITLLRNISSFSFSDNETTNSEIEEKIKSALEEINQKGHFANYIPLTDEKAKEILAENEIELTTKEIKNGGLMVFDREGIFGVINDYDNIKLYLRVKEPKTKISSLFVGFIKVLNEIGKHIQCLYDDHLGFISSSPKLLGTGMEIKMGLKLEKSTKEMIEETIKGSELEFNFVADNHVEVWNKITIGESETELMRNFLIKIKTIITKEK